MADATFQPDPDLYPFESRWLDVDWPTTRARSRLHYIDEGDPAARPILFLHGNPTWSFLYRDIIRRLRDRYRCMAVDYPGFGLSAPPSAYGYSPAEHAAAVLALVRRLDLRGLTIMGQDWGGPIGLRVALDEPGRVAALVFGNTWYGRARAWRLRLFSRVMSSPPARWAILRRNALVEWLMPFAADREFPPRVMEHYRAVLPTPESRRGVVAFSRQILAAGDWLGEIERAVPATLSHLSVLLTWGKHDRAFRPSFMERFRRDFASVEAVELEANHYIQEDAPAEIAAAIRRFLE